MRLTRLLALVPALLSLSTTAALAEEPLGPAHEPWLQGLTLVTTPDAQIETIQAARVAIQLKGGRVGLISQMSGQLMAVFPGELDQELLAERSIASIHREAVSDIQLSKHGAEGRLFANSFNAFVSGDYARQKAEERELTKDQPAREPVPDVRTPESGEWDDYIANLEAQGLDPDELEARGLLELSADKGPTDIMGGLVSVTIFFPESDGSGAYPNLYTWTDEDLEFYITDTNAGLLFWSQVGNTFGCWNAYMVRYFHPTDARLQTEYEPTLIPNDIDLMVDDIMNNFGFFGNHFSQTEAYNTWQCATYGADRAYCAFVGYNPPPAGGSMPGGAVAWAYFYGPYTYLLAKPDGGNPGSVFAHETGHIFGACDEYASSNCGCSQSCSNGVQLGNCENCAGYGPCIMGAGSILTLCNFTDAHVGWRINPCAPPPLPAPTVTSLSPDSGLVGTDVDVTVTGANFFYGTFLDIGNAGTTVAFQFIDSNTVIVTLRLENLAEPGLVDIDIVNRDLQKATLAQGFDVIPTPRHYMSSGGNNNFPYLTPADAANTLSDVLAAAGPGDSVLVDLEPLSNIQLNLTRRVGIYGGWTNNFQTRDPADRTVIEIQGNFKVQQPVTLDGLELHGGFGRQEFSPLNSVFGGAVTVRNSSLTVRNCLLRDNAAPIIPGDGGGGALYAFNSTLEVYDSTISGNTSHHGGAIYMIDSSGTISGNTITGNDLTHPTSDTNGAAIYMVDSSDVLLENNQIDGNLSSDHGGAIYAENTTGITVRGGTISNSSAGFTGGAIALIGSDAVVENVTFDTNDALIQGGAIFADAASGLTATGNTFRGNSAQLGGAINQTTSPVTINHNTFDANSAQFSGSAMFINSAPSGDILGNTLHGNVTSVAGGAAMALSASTATVKHNVISGSSHVGLFCSGSPTLGFNLYHGNAEADASGCGVAASSLTGDPLFVDAAGHDFHLGLDSPGIDAAEAFHDDPDGSAGDLGVYGTRTFVMDQPSYPKNVVVDVVGSDLNVSWDANPEGDLAAYAVYGGTVGFVPGAANRLSLVTAPTTTVDLGPQPGVTHIRVSAVDNDGYAGGFSAEVAVDTQTEAELPESFVTQLRGNVPNPFNPSTEVRYEVGVAGRVQLMIYDVTGRVVRTLVDDVHKPGLYQSTWFGQDDSGVRVASGVYFSKLVTADIVHTQKMTLLK